MQPAAEKGGLPDDGDCATSAKHPIDEIVKHLGQQPKQTSGTAVDLSGLKDVELRR